MNETRRQQTTKGGWWFRYYLAACLFHSLADHSAIVTLDSHPYLVTCYRHLDVQGEEHERIGYGCRGN